jgi:hypothetical protein
VKDCSRSLAQWKRRCDATTFARRSVPRIHFKAIFGEVQRGSAFGDRYEPCKKSDRPYALGRRNWIFPYAVKGAKASAALYSVASTVRANGLGPYAYLRRLFTELPKVKTFEDFEPMWSRSRSRANVYRFCSAPS